MNYLSNKTATYSFNGKGECFLSLEDKNDRIKIENCYRHEMQENLFYQIISSDDIANIYYLDNNGLNVFKENVQIKKCKNFIFTIEDDILNYFVYDNNEIKNVLKEKRTGFWEIEDDMKELYWNRNKQKKIAEFEKELKELNVTLIFGKDNITQKAKINQKNTITSLINDDYRIKDITICKDKKTYHLFMDSEHNYWHIIKRSFGSGCASNQSKENRTDCVNEEIDSLIDNNKSYRASTFSTLRKYCIENIEQESCLYTDIISEILDIESTRNKKRYFIFYGVVGSQAYRELEHLLHRGFLDIEELAKMFYSHSIEIDNVVYGEK